MGLWTTHKTEYVSEFGPLKVGGIYQVPDTHKYPKEEHYGIFLYGRNPKPASSKNVRKMRNWDVVRVFVVRVVVRLPFSSFPASLTTPNRSLVGVSRVNSSSPLEVRSLCFTDQSVKPQL
jgi:hypothetical protein